MPHLLPHHRIRTLYIVMSALLVTICAWGGFSLYRHVVAPYARMWKEKYRGIDYPSEYGVRGIDVSHHQGAIDWKEVQSATLGGSPISFVFIKATEGDRFTDDTFQHNFEQARLFGFLRGAYHYYIPRVSARRQARHFLRSVPYDEGDLPPVLDVEEFPDGANEAAFCDSVLSFLQTVETHLGVRPILYASARFYAAHLAQSTAFREYPLWVAHYYVDAPSVERPWKFWQHTDQAVVPGIQERVDVNVYNGSMYELQRLGIRSR